MIFNLSISRKMSYFIPLDMYYLNIKCFLPKVYCNTMSTLGINMRAGLWLNSFQTPIFLVFKSRLYYFTPDLSRISTEILGIIFITQWQLSCNHSYSLWFKNRKIWFIFPKIYSKKQIPTCKFHSLNKHLLSTYHMAGDYSWDYS